MTITRVLTRADGAFDAIADGLWASGIHSASRFWPDVQQWIAAGNTPEVPPIPPLDVGVQRKAALLDALDAFDRDIAPTLAKLKPLLKVLREYLA